MKNINVKIIGWVFSLGVAPLLHAGPDGGVSGSSAAMTLNEAIRSALAVDPGVRKKYSDVTEARGYSREMRSALGPQLRLEGLAGWANRDRSIDGVASGGDDLFSRQVGLVLEQLLFDGGFHWYRWKDAEERLKAERLRDIAMREGVAFETVKAYLDVIRTREHIFLARSNVELHKRIVGLADERAEAAGNQADIDLSNARYNLAKVLLRERELALKQADTVFFRYTSQSPVELVKPRRGRIVSRSEVDVSRNYHYQAAHHQREGATIAKKSVKARYIPRVLFRGTGGVGEDVLGIRGEDNEASALVVVQWDLFDSGRRKGLMEQAIADVDRQTAIIDETLVLLTQDVESRWHDYVSSAERIQILSDYSDDLKKTVELYEEQFDLGTRPLLSVLDIKNEEIGARIRMVDEGFEHELSTYRLFFLSGSLISETLGPDYLETPRDQADNGNYESHAWAAPEQTRAAPAAVSAGGEKPRRITNLFGLFGRD